MRFIVTGSAGFIGSTIVEELLSDGFTVVGVDNFNSLLYSGDVKRKRISKIQSRFRNFTNLELDLAKEKMDNHFETDDVLIHCAGLPGQLLSWESFAEYNNANFVATQKLIEAAAKANINNFVFASTSSVYGGMADVTLGLDLKPISPYGVTKLACESLLSCYGIERNLRYVVLRYFSVYGPGQRPDMAIHRFLSAIFRGDEIILYGDGSQKRDFTYVNDCARATIKASNIAKQGEIYDISGGTVVSVSELLEVCFEVTGSKTPVRYSKRNRGDQHFTRGNREKSKFLFDDFLTTELFEGVKAQWQSLLVREE